jgi:hypothetical protein
VGSMLIGQRTCTSSTTSNPAQPASCAVLQDIAHLSML